MSSNPLYGLRKVETFVQLTGLLGRPMRQPVFAAAVRSTTLVSDEKRIRGVRRTRRCAIQIDNLYLYVDSVS